MNKTIEIALGERSYSVDIGSGLLDDAGEKIYQLGDITSAVVITDSNVGPLYASQLTQSLTKATIPTTVLTFPAGEENKTLATCQSLYNQIFSLTPTVDRHSIIITLGGGVTGDLAGFIAATTLRGIRFVQCPTSLLADVDASAGGKTGIDHPSGKNLIGAFHQPRRVIIDVETLKTLPADQIASGLAECVKHAVIRDENLLAMIERDASDLQKVEPDTTAELIARNIAIKAKIVAADERETSVRELLNFGHTFGHAIETAAGFGAMSHGQAVALGMVAACRASVELGYFNNTDSNRVEQLLASLGLATRRSDMDINQLIELMKHDKKSRGGIIRFILPTSIGSAQAFDDVPEHVVKLALEYLDA